MKKKIIYVGDPVCAWCFAFTDIFEKIRNQFKDQVDFSYIMGGLVIDKEICLDEKLKNILKKNWKQIETKTGKYIEACDIIDEAKKIPYKSDPACIGFACVKSVDEEMAYTFYKNLHKSFYEGLTDISTTENLCNLAVNSGMDESDFMDRFSKEKFKEIAFDDMAKARQLGVQAFPALVLMDESGTSVLNQGFKNYSLLKMQIEAWLSGETRAKNMLPVL